MLGEKRVTHSPGPSPPCLPKTFSSRPCSEGQWSLLQSPGSGPQSLSATWFINTVVITEFSIMLSLLGLCGLLELGLLLSHTWDSNKSPQGGRWSLYTKPPSVLELCQWGEDTTYKYPNKFSRGFERPLPICSIMANIPYLDSLNQCAGD